jgi:hypothetical protein
MNITQVTVAAIAAAPMLASAADAGSVEDRLRALEQRQQKLEQMIEERDRRIEQLEAERSAADVAPAITSPVAPTLAAQAPAVAPAPAARWGSYERGKGMVLARTDLGEVDFSVFSYVRYLNQTALADSFTDSFGRTNDLRLRQDMQLQKVNLSFKGWLFDPDFRYLFYTWTSNTSQGQGAQVVVAGNLSYHFNDAFSLAGGIGALPSTRSTNYTFPNWLRVDHRTIGDEFFRGSYTSGIWAWGNLADRLQYRVMVGNNLSQLGIDAGQLDSDLSTISGALWWMPTTGEYGPGQGFGDFENHEDLATLFSMHFTHSREDAQSQAGVNDFENSQIRLSDGTRIFQPGAFDTDGQIRKATYKMAATSAGFKYRGWSLDGEYYWRWVDDFKTVGEIPVDELFDHGFQLQGSTMLVPRTLQAYVSGSQIFGEYGDPWDTAIGLNWFPMKRAELRVNLQGLYLDRSPVGYSSVPFVVGGDGWVFTTDVMLSF